MFWAVAFPWFIPTKRGWERVGSAGRKPSLSQGFFPFVLAVSGTHRKRRSPLPWRLTAFPDLVLASHQRFPKTRMAQYAPFAQTCALSLRDRRAIVVSGPTIRAGWSVFHPGGGRRLGTMIPCQPIVWPTGSVPGGQARVILGLHIGQGRSMGFGILPSSMRAALLTASTVRTGAFVNA